MDVLMLLIGVSVLVAAIFLIAFLYAVKSGQMEDKYTPSVRILFEDEVVNDEDSDEDEGRENKGSKKSG